MALYVAVIPKWFAGLINNETVFINGDGKTRRDFCFKLPVMPLEQMRVVLPDPRQYRLSQFNYKCNQLLCFPLTYNANLVILGNVSLRSTCIQILCI